jgi:hypothetical protein
MMLPAIVGQVVGAVEQLQGVAFCEHAQRLALAEALVLGKVLTRNNVPGRFEAGIIVMNHRDLCQLVTVASFVP